MNTNTQPSFWKKLLQNFTIKREQENFGDIMQSIRDGVSFRWTNLWILVFAILLASIGLNVNSASVVIGAMLISPLMWPIIWIGVSIGINDSALLKRSLKNFLFSAIISLIASMVYFLISPISEAYSELLARTSPTIYDVFIALFGGLAGIIAIVSQKKWNVIPWVAIATALMPPLCTAGYWIATWQWEFFFGALYLFFINSVFIGFSAFMVIRLLRFPYKEFPDEDERKRSRNIIIFMVSITLIPSIYFGYDVISQNNFVNSANIFVEKETEIQDSYLLKKNIDPKSRTITLIFGWKTVDKEQIEEFKKRLDIYDLQNTNIIVKQWFSSFYETQKIDWQVNNQNQIKIEELTAALRESEDKIKNIEQNRENYEKNIKSIFYEIKIIEPNINELFIEKWKIFEKNNSQDIEIAYIKLNENIEEDQQNKLDLWLKTRLENNNLVTIFKVEKDNNTENTENKVETQSGSITNEKENLK